MATATAQLITALRATAERLDQGAKYAWTHLGACNCGHLAQTVTALSAHEIREAAMRRAGEWREQALEYCPTSGYPIDHIMGKLIELGLDPLDFGHLERLSDPVVLRRLPVERRINLSYRRRADVVLYMRTWADHLERARGSHNDAPPDSGERVVAQLNSAPTAVAS